MISELNKWLTPGSLHHHIEVASLACYDLPELDPRNPVLDGKDTLV